MNTGDLIELGRSWQQALPDALLLAKRAWKLNPKDVQALAAIVSLEIKLGHFEEALAALDRAKHPAHRRETARWRGMIHLAQATVYRRVVPWVASPERAAHLDRPAAEAALAGAPFRVAPVAEGVARSFLSPPFCLGTLAFTLFGRPSVF